MGILWLFYHQSAWKYMDTVKRNKWATTYKKGLIDCQNRFHFNCNLHIFLKLQGNHFAVSCSSWISMSSLLSISRKLNKNKFICTLPSLYTVHFCIVEVITYLILWLFFTPVPLSEVARIWQPVPQLVDTVTRMTWVSLSVSCLLNSDGQGIKLSLD